jgi:hypothetical protein
VGAPPFRPSWHAIEFGFASLVQLARRATGHELVPEGTRLSQSASKDRARHHRLFGTVIDFDTDYDEIAFSHEQLKRPLITADDSLREVVEAHARERVTTCIQVERSAVVQTPSLTGPPHWAAAKLGPQRSLGTIACAASG